MLVAAAAATEMAAAAVAARAALDLNDDDAFLLLDVATPVVGARTKHTRTSPDDTAADEGLELASCKKRARMG